MVLPLSGKVALVTGSSSPLGAAIAERLADDGASVVANYGPFSGSEGSECIAAAQQLVNLINGKRPNAAVGVETDVLCVASCRELVDKTIQIFGKVDILVLSAEIARSDGLEDMDEKIFDEVFSVNVKAPLFLVQAAAPLMSPGGRIIFMSTSTTRTSTILADNLVYASSKGVVEQFTRVLAKDLGSRGITVNCISPGPMAINLFQSGKSEQQIQYIANLNPQKRVPRPEEIAPVVAFLASPDASWINGQNLPVNGAFTV